MPTLPLNLLKVLKYVIPGLVLIGLVWGIFHLGSNHGAAQVQAKWGQVELERTKAILTQQVEDGVKEAKHIAKDKEIEKGLNDATSKHEATVAKLNADWSKRVLQSEGRAGIYKRQAEGTEAEQSRLALHAAELDRSLEEGRQVVAELRSLIEQRDSELRLLADQIKNDRSLLDEVNGS